MVRGFQCRRSLREHPVPFTILTTPPGRRHPSQRGLHSGQPSVAERVKGVVSKYGTAAVVLHSSVYVTSLASCYLAIRQGFDLAHILDLWGSYLPSWLRAVAADDDSSSANPVIDITPYLPFPVPSFLDAETSARLLLAWTFCAATGPVRGLVTIVGAPMLAQALGPSEEVEEVENHTEIEKSKS